MRLSHICIALISLVACAAEPPPPARAPSPPGQARGTPATLNNANTAAASFVAPNPAEPIEVATFALTASNACGATAIDTVSIVIVRL